MTKPKQVEKKDWFDVLDDQKRCVIPIGPRFQADVPQWNGLPKILNSSKWLGDVIWSNKDTNNTTPSENKRDVVGRGRPHHCDCYNAGSILCVKRHISEKSTHLQKELGPAFRIWRFDEMGDTVARLWKLSEEQRFARVFKKKPESEGKNNSIKLALQCFPSKSFKTVVSYYFNVYIPRQISVKTRSGCRSVSSSDDENMTPSREGSRKRGRVDGVGLSSKFLSNGYLAGRR